MVSIELISPPNLPLTPTCHQELRGRKVVLDQENDIGVQGLAHVTETLVLVLALAQGAIGVLVRGMIDAALDATYPIALVRMTNLAPAHPGAALGVGVEVGAEVGAGAGVDAALALSTKRLNDSSELWQRESQIMGRNSRVFYASEKGTTQSFRFYGMIG